MTDTKQAAIEAAEIPEDVRKTAEAEAYTWFEDHGGERWEDMVAVFVRCIMADRASRTPDQVQREGWVPLTQRGDRMSCPLPADETVVKVMLQDGETCSAWYSGNIMEAGDWDMVPVDEHGEPDFDADSIVDKVVAWRIAAPPPPDQSAGRGEAVANIVPEGCSGTAFCFAEGVLHVNKDGSGYIAVDEDDWELEDDRCEGPDGPEGSVHWIARMDASEIIALRDFLNGAPPASGDTEVLEERRFHVPKGQTPLDDDLRHPLLDVFNEGMKSREGDGRCPYHGHSLERCIFTSGWIQRDLRLALNAALATPQPATRDEVVEALEIIAGERQCSGNFLSDKEIAQEVLARLRTTKTEGSSTDA